MMAMIATTSIPGSLLVSLLVIIRESLLVVEVGGNVVVDVEKSDVTSDSVPSPMASYTFRCMSIRRYIKQIFLQ